MSEKLYINKITQQYKKLHQINLQTYPLNTDGSGELNSVATFHSTLAEILFKPMQSEKELQNLVLNDPNK